MKATVRPTRSIRSVVAAVALGAVLAGCTNGSDEPVPTTAQEPFVCDGVPLEGARLITGESGIERESSGGSWNDMTDPIVCNLQTADGPGVLTVSQEPLDWAGASDAETYLKTLAEKQDARQITAEADGGGYAYPEGDDIASAQWACHDYRLTVTAYRLAGGDRDPLTDVSRYLTSMLPWACGGQDAPPRLVEG